MSYVFLLNVKDASGSPLYVYIKIDADRLDAFKECLVKGEPAALEELGEILEYGPGTPPEDVKARMERDYAFDHENMLFIKDA